MEVVIFIIIVVVILLVVANSGSSTKQTTVETELQRQARLRREREQQEERERQASLQRTNEQREQVARQAEQRRLAEQRATQQQERAQAEQQRQQSLALQRKQFKAKRLTLQETGTDYSNAISNIMRPTPNFWKIYEYNVSETSHLTANQILNTGNGTAIIQHSQTLINYIAAYGGMHYHKLQTSFTSLFANLPNNASIDIIDYGCGQALATMAFYDYAIRNNKNFHVDKIILIEPSDLALRRGILKLNYFIEHKNQDTEILKVNKSLDELTNTDLQTNFTNIKIHFFSNIIDVVGFNYVQLANKIKTTQKGVNLLVCVSPDNANAQTRINGFQNCFSQTNIPCYSGTIYGKAFRIIGKNWLDNHRITMVQRIFKCNF